MEQNIGNDTDIITPRVRTETGRLREVIIGLPDSFSNVSLRKEPINRRQERYFKDHPEPPTADDFLPEFEQLKTVLHEHGVRVHQPIPVSGVYDQLTPRDLGVVIDDVFVICAMRPPSRREEWHGLDPILDRIPPKNMRRVPADCFIEGGDIIYHRETLYIGISERTSPEGVDYMQDQFGSRMPVIPIPLNTQDPDQDILHLDCAFMPVGSGHALVYPDGMREIPGALRESYEWLELTHDEQLELGTNVLSLDQSTIISRPSLPHVNAMLRDIGIDVIEIPFVHTPKSGGSFRCATLPLQRDCLPAETT